MNWMKMKLIASLSLLTAGPVSAAGPAPVSPADRYARRCQQRTPSRDRNPQGTLLWGARQRWDGRATADERTSVLVSADLEHPAFASGDVKALQLDGGHLVATAGKNPVGTVLQGTSSDGQPVEVALCAAEPSPGDPGMVWYQIEAWNPVTQDWENPCVATGEVPNPRALAMAGVWDASGAHHDVAGKLTFACENGVLSKCARWGYRPWATYGGRSLAEAHQACTRMARADYCGNGRSHTREGTMIEYYDALGLSLRTTEVSASWDPAKTSFEAAWAPDGASCLARTRNGEPLATILQECPERFRTAAADLGDGDRCSIQQSNAGATAALMRNRIYDRRRGNVTHPQGE